MVAGYAKGIGTKLSWTVQGALDKQLFEAREHLAAEALKLGADAVIGIHFDYTTLTFMVLTGTAVRYMR